MASRLRQFLFNIKHYTLITFLTILVLVLAPFVFFLIFFPVYIWRWIVRLLKILFRPDLAKMISPRSTAMTIDKHLEPNPKCNLVVLITFEGVLTLADIITQFVSKVPIADENRDSLQYPEFYQYYEYWLGFMFHKWETEYSIPDHFSYYNPEDPTAPVTAEDLVNIELELVQEPYPPNFSPWRIVVIPNFISKTDEEEANNNNNGDKTKNEKAQKSVVCFKLHHGIADGFSILNLLMKEICQIHENEIAKPKNYFNKSLGRQILDATLLPLSAPFEFIKQLIESYDVNEWRIDEAQMSSTWFSTQTLIPLDLNYVKSIKNLHGVDFTTVLVEALSGGIRNYLLKRKRPIPDKMSCLVPFPMPGFDHTTKLRNFFSYAFLKFPIGIETPQKRLQCISQNISSLKTSSTLLASNFWEIPIVARLFPAMMKPLLYNRFSTCILSNFPGPNDPCSFLGKNVTAIGFNAGLLIGNTGLGFMMMSYNGKCTFRINGCQSIFPTKADLDELLSLVLEELKVLKQNGNHEV